MPTCPAIKKSTGGPCTVSFGPFGSDGKCYWHTEDADMASHRREGQSRGGKFARDKGGESELPPLDFPSSPQTINECREYLSWIAHHALTGQLDTKAADSAVKALLTWIKAEDYARQIRELRKMITDLQKTAKRA